MVFGKQVQKWSMWYTDIIKNMYDQYDTAGSEREIEEYLDTITKTLDHNTHNQIG